MKAAEGFEKKGRIIGASEFAYNRVTRIYPLYWIVLLPASAIAVFTTGSAMENAGLSYERVFMLLDGSPALAVAWTLKYEIYFYALMTALMMVGWGNLRQTLLIFAVVYAAVLAFAMFMLLPWFLTSSYFLEFVFGMMVFLATDRGWKVHGLIVSLIGAAGLAYGTYVTLDDPWSYNFSRPFLLGIPSMVLLYGMICLEKRWQAPKIATAIGDASYSIYLWHFAILHPMYILKVWEYPQVYTSPTTVAATVVLMVLIGMMSYRFIEIPLANLARRLRIWVFSPSHAVPLPAE